MATATAVWSELDLAATAEAFAAAAAAAWSALDLAAAAAAWSGLD